MIISTLFKATASWYKKIQATFKSNVMPCLCNTQSVSVISSYYSF